MSRRYKLTIDEAQADAVIAAMDLYSRLHMGQYKELREIGLARAKTGTDWTDWNRRNDEAIQRLKAVHFPEHPMNASYGICSEQVPVRARLCYDVQQVIRKRIAEDRGAQDWDVWLRPFMSTSQHPFIAKIESVEGED